jgi:four helix bundle protein
MNQILYKNKIYEFSDLIVWQEAHKLCLIIYKETVTFPKHELFGLTSQMRRASISITSNIAEGFGRRSYKEKCQFYYHSYGSLTEIQSQLLLARDLHYITTTSFDSISKQINSTQILLRAFIKSTKQRI